MKIITSRPIITPQTNGGISNFDDFANCCGMSGFDNSFSYADDNKSEKSSAVKEYLGQQKTSRKTSRTNAVTDVLADKTVSKDLKRQNRATARDTKQSERALRVEARHTRKTDRKASKNAKKLTLVKTSKGDKFFFPLSRVRLGKKKYKDGTEVKVKPEDQVTAIDPTTKEVVTFDKKEVATALDKPVSTVTTADAQQLLQPLPVTETISQNTKLETGDKPNETPFGILVDDTKIEVVNDGEPYMANQTQGATEKDKDVKDKENGLSKTQKIVLVSAGVVVLSLVSYLIYKAVKN
jgi:hypothetical protein